MREKRPRRASQCRDDDGRAQKALRRATYVDYCKNRRWGNRKGLGNETRSSIGSFGEVPNCWQRNHGSKKADNQNVQRMGVGVVGHSILHHHEENVGALLDFLCGNFARHKPAQHNGLRACLHELSDAK